MNIIESVTMAKVTPSSCIHSRLRRPSPGDAVDFSLMGGRYPFTQRYGTIESVGGGFAKENEAHVCCEPGSIFWGDGYVSISGGPFECIPLERLVWDGVFKTQWFWNWGNLGAGAGHSCHFGIRRPVFSLLPEGRPANLHPLYPRTPGRDDEAPPLNEALGALAWCIRQMQGESGASHSHWEQHPEYMHALRLVQNHEPIPPAAPDDAVPGQG